MMAKGIAWMVVALAVVAIVGFNAWKDGYRRGLSDAVYARTLPSVDVQVARDVSDPNDTLARDAEIPPSTVFELQNPKLVNMAPSEWPINTWMLFRAKPLYGEYCAWATDGNRTIQASCVSTEHLAELIVKNRKQ